MPNPKIHLSVDLPLDAITEIDQVIEAGGPPNRSAVIRYAIRVLSDLREAVAAGGEIVVRPKDGPARAVTFPTILPHLDSTP